MTHGLAFMVGGAENIINHKYDSIHTIFEKIHRDENPKAENNQNSEVPTYTPLVLFFSFLFFFFKDLFIHESHTEREAETQAEGEAGSMQGARCRT